MDNNLYFWILTVIEMSSKIEYYADSLEERINGLSVCLTKETRLLFDEIIALNNKKIMLINMKVLYDSLFAALKKDERLIIKEYANNKSLEEISKILDVNKSTVLRRINRAVQKCALALTSLGYDVKRFNDEFRDYAAIYCTYNRIKNEHRVRQNAAQKKAEEEKKANRAIILPDNDGRIDLQKAF